MQRMTDEQRKEWTNAVTEAKKQLQGDCPLWEEAQLVSADEHIKFLEYRLAIYATLVDRYMCRTMSKEDVKKFIDDNLAEEALQGE